ncbi:hypothetical protein M8J76_004016 [Diaphorina citri]|nr:hypothetical protein M8J76_004016 [Diaphorina citri]
MSKYEIDNMPRNKEKKLIKVDETDPIGEIEPSFPWRDVVIKRNVDIKEYYDLQSEIGRGKFGTVYRCKEKATGMTLAAKFVGIAKRNDRRNVEREVEIMRELQHPRLIQIYDAFESSNVIIEGGELFERVIDDDFVLTEKAVAIFMRQICEGVEFIHSKNVLHLDMKPENILCLTKTGNRIKIIDFGLARKFDPEKKLQVLFGTPEFVAPEVVNFDAIGFGTDMWSVGVICYVLLSGLSPFMGETDVQTMANVTIAQYDFDDECFNEISDDAKDFIRKLLLKDREARMTAAQCLQHPWLSRHPTPDPNLANSKDNIKECLERWSPEKQLPTLNTKKNLKQNSPPSSEKKLKLDISVAEDVKENAPPNAEKRLKHELQHTPDDVTGEKKMKLDKPTSPTQNKTSLHISSEPLNVKSPEVTSATAATTVIDKKSKLHPPPTPDVESTTKAENSAEKKMKVHTPFTPEQTSVPPLEKVNSKSNVPSQTENRKDTNETVNNKEQTLTTVDNVIETAQSNKTKPSLPKLDITGNVSSETKKSSILLDKQMSVSPENKSKLESPSANTFVMSPVDEVKEIHLKEASSKSTTPNACEKVKVTTPVSPIPKPGVESLPKATSKVSPINTNEKSNTQIKQTEENLPRPATKVLSGTEDRINNIVKVESLSRQPSKISRVASKEKLNTPTSPVATPPVEKLTNQTTKLSPSTSTSSIPNKPLVDNLPQTLTKVSSSSQDKVNTIDVNPQTKIENLPKPISQGPTPVSNQKPNTQPSSTLKATQESLPKASTKISPAVSKEKLNTPASPVITPTIERQESLPKPSTKISPTASKEKINTSASPVITPTMESLQNPPKNVTQSVSNEKQNTPTSPLTQPTIENVPKPGTKVQSPGSNNKVNTSDSTVTSPKAVETLTFITKGQVNKPTVEQKQTPLEEKLSKSSSKVTISTNITKNESTKETSPATKVEKPSVDETNPNKTISTSPTAPKTPTNVTAQKTPTSVTAPKTPTSVTAPKTPTSATVPTMPTSVTAPKTPTSATAPTVHTSVTAPKTSTSATAPTIPTSVTPPKTSTSATSPKILNNSNEKVTEDIAKLKIDDKKKEPVSTPPASLQPKPAPKEIRQPSPSKESAQDSPKSSSPSKMAISNPLNIPIISSGRTFQRGVTKSNSPDSRNILERELSTTTEIPSKSQSTAESISAQNDKIIQKISELTATATTNTIAPSETITPLRTIRVRREMSHESNEVTNEKTTTTVKNGSVIKSNEKSKESTEIKETKTSSTVNKTNTPKAIGNIESKGNASIESAKKNVGAPETSSTSNVKIPRIITHQIHLESDEAESSKTCTDKSKGSNEHNRPRLNVGEDYRQERRASDLSCFFPGEDDFITEEINRLSDRLKDLKSSSFDNGSTGESLLTRMRRPKYKISHCSRDVPVNSPPPPSNMAYYMRTNSPRSQSPTDDVLIKFLTQFNDKSDAKAKKLDVPKKETTAAVKRMTAEVAENHKWLRDAQEKVKLSKTKLKRYVIKKRWIRAVNMILALHRMGAKIGCLG